MRSGHTGAALGVFATGNGLDAPIDLAFGRDDNLYVASTNANQVLRFAGGTGAFLGVFVPPGGGGLNTPGRGACNLGARGPHADLPGSTSTR